MAVTHIELIEAAQATELAARNEAEFRSVCSRAYYAIFQDGRAFHDGLPSHGSIPVGFEGGMHARLIQQLTVPTVSRADPLFIKSMSIGYLMKSLYAKRIKADYHRDIDIDKPTATSAIAEAVRIIATLQGAVPPSSTPVTPTSISRTDDPAAIKGARPTLQRIK